MKRQAAAVAGERVYRVIITDAPADHAERRIREVIERKGGDLKLLFRRTPAQPHRIHVHLGMRRIDDVLAALEGAGFDVCAQGAVLVGHPSPGSKEGK